jgi:exodeoxyribonuclease-3
VIRAKAPSFAAGRVSLVRIVSWNVNGLRSIEKKGFHRFVARVKPDVIGVQETRARIEQLSPRMRSPKTHPHTHFVHAERAGYSGVAVYSRHPLDAADGTLGAKQFDVEGRVQVVKIGALTIVNGYFPNGSGKDRDNSRVAYKLKFYRALYARLDAAVHAGERIVVMGDFNTAPREIDLARPRENAKTSGFLPSEREELMRWLQRGWVDSFRVFETRGDIYSWWSQRYGVREKNIGWRIDLALVSPGASRFLKSAKIHTDVKGSDHAPIELELDDAVVSSAASRSG